MGNNDKNESIEEFDNYTLEIYNSEKLKVTSEIFILNKLNIYKMLDDFNGKNIQNKNSNNNTKINKSIKSIINKVANV